MKKTNFTLPSCDAAHPPKMDNAVTYLIPRLGKSYDWFLSKLEKFSMDKIGPLMSLCEQLEVEEAEDEHIKCWPNLTG